MNKHRRRPDGLSVLIYLIAGLLAFLAGATIVVAPILLVFPALALSSAVLLILAVCVIRNTLSLWSKENWRRRALIVVIVHRAVFKGAAAGVNAEINPLDPQQAKMPSVIHFQRLLKVRWADGRRPESQKQQMQFSVLRFVLARLQ